MTATLQELSSLDGRVVLIVGGAGHIGRRIAHALAEWGASIAVADIDVDRAHEVASDVRLEHGVDADHFAIDLEDSDEARQLPRRVVERFGRLDVLVHSAALVGTTPLEGWTTPFEQQSVVTWRRALEVNLTSAFVLCQSAAKHLAESGHGSVILVGSIYGTMGSDPSLYEGTDMGRPAGYFASKGGLNQLMRWMATELAPAVRVNTLCPGGVERGQDPEFVTRYQQKTPLKRMATEDDLIGAAAFLASDLSSYVTGQVLLIDGGISIT